MSRRPDLKSLSNAQLKRHLASGRRHRAKADATQVGPPVTTADAGKVAIAEPKAAQIAPLPTASSSLSTRLQLEKDPSETDAEGRASVPVSPAVQAACTMVGFTKEFGEVSLSALTLKLAEHIVKLNNGDLTQTEVMLFSQAHTLDSIFNSLARRAAANIQEHLSIAERYLRLGLKAQSQCRTTLETLELIRNPRSVAFIRQANLAHNQQVNNGDAPQGPRARETSETESEPNKLLEAAHGERLDT